MTATAYNGTGDWTYTNSTGGNVRVIIAFFLFKERPGVRNILGIVISFIGVFIGNYCYC